MFGGSTQVSLARFLSMLRASISTILKKFQDSENTLSQIIPSYTSTIKALSYARLCASRAVKLKSSETSILVVKMPTTPGHRSLPGVDHEKFAIQQITKDVCRIKTLESPTAAQVLNNISGFI